MTKAQFSLWQLCYLARVHEGQMPKSKLEKEKLVLLSEIGETVTVVFPKTEEKPERTQFLIVTRDYGDIPHGYIDVVTLAGNLRLWKSRNYEIYSDGKRLFTEPEEVHTKDSSIPTQKSIFLTDLYAAIEKAPISEQEKKSFIKIARDVSIQSAKELERVKELDEAEYHSRLSL